MSTAGVAAQEIRVTLNSGFLRDGQAMGSLSTCWGSRRQCERFCTHHKALREAWACAEHTSGEMEEIACSLNNQALCMIGWGPGGACSCCPGVRRGIHRLWWRQQPWECRQSSHRGGRCWSLTPFLSFPGRVSTSAPANSHHLAEQGPSQKPSLPPLILPGSESWGAHDEDRVLGGFKKLSVNGGCAPTPPLTPMKSGLSPCPYPVLERGSRPLPPLPISEGPSLDDTDCEVEFFTCSDTDLLLEDHTPCAFKYGIPGRRSFRGCGQINYAYFDTPAVSVVDLSQAPDQNTGGPHSDPPVPQTHRRLRRSHSGPAGSFNKPAIKIHSYAHRASPNSDEDKPEVPPRVPIPPRPMKPDYRRWSAEVTSSTYSDEDRPPKVPPREPLSRSNSRTPSPKSLPSYLNGVMPPTQSFAPDPKYVSSKALQRQNSEGSTGRVPCILPIIENGRKVSSTHYYLLPERPPYLDRYEKFFKEAEETNMSTHVQPLPTDGGSGPTTEKLDSKARADLGGHGKRKHLSYVVSP